MNDTEAEVMRLVKAFIVAAEHEDTAAAADALARVLAMAVCDLRRVADALDKIAAR